ncbi:MAG: hypothetical protein HQL79_09725 [Magnetococcales bacterium]|nr:hypothetical protein [Magnetococcales bacterium]
MAAQRTTPERTFFELLGGLAREAKAERLECAVTLMETLRMVVREYRAHSATPGYVTVEGWLHLLTQWENNLKASPRRHITYAIAFFQEAIKREECKVPPVSPLLSALLTLMAEHTAALDSKAAA